jgi:hypothetical protein
VQLGLQHNLDAYLAKGRGLAHSGGVMTGYCERVSAHVCTSLKDKSHITLERGGVGL